MNLPKISIDFDGRNCDYSKAFHKLAMQKVEDAFSGAPVHSIDLKCSVENKEHVIKAHVHLAHKSCFIDDVSRDMYTTLDRVIDKVRRVVWDEKERTHRPIHESPIKNPRDRLTG